MHKVSTERKTFSKILVAIYELNKSTAAPKKEMKIMSAAGIE